MPTHDKLRNQSHGVEFRPTKQFLSRLVQDCGPGAPDSSGRPEQWYCPRRLPRTCFEQVAENAGERMISPRTRDDLSSCGVVRETSGRKRLGRRGEPPSRHLRHLTTSRAGETLARGIFPARAARGPSTREDHDRSPGTTEPERPDRLDPKLCVE